jgi:hypothetical protein
LIVERCKSQKKIEVFSIIRQMIAVDIIVQNTDKKYIVFEVFFDGDGLMGEKSLSV